MDSNKPSGYRPDSGGAGRLAETAASEAKQVWKEARNSARESVERRRHEAASGIGELAGALHSSAEDLGQRHRETVAGLVHGAADGLDRLSGTLRSKDLDTLVRDAEAFARREPVLFFGAAVAAGFMALRLLKTGRPDSSIDEDKQPAGPTRPLH